ncbi:MAG: hypothetical protein AABN95_15995 [Acidobacteriota bacterium]
MPLEKRPNYLSLGVAVFVAEAISLLPWIITGEWLLTIIGLIFFPLCGALFAIQEHQQRVKRRTPWPPPEMFEGPSGRDDWR